MSDDLKEPIEIEYKYEADHIDWTQFVDFVKSLNPARELKVAGPDHYYVNDDYVIRHRYNAKLNELTVKTRKHKRITTVRGEINLTLPNKLNPKLVNLFLNAIGFKKEFEVNKSCHIFWFDGPHESKVSVVIYDVSLDGSLNKDRYIEIEVEDAETIKDAKDELKRWGKILKDGVMLMDSKRINESLYEIYSGKKYRMQKA